MEDVKLGGLETVETCKCSSTSSFTPLHALTSLVKLRIEPTAILLSTKIDESVEALLDPGAGREGSTDEFSKTFPILETVHRTLF